MLLSRCKLACCFWLLAAAHVQSAVVKNRRWAQPDYSIYHDEAALMDAVSKVVASQPNTMTMDTMQHSNGNYSAVMEVVSIDLSRQADAGQEKLRLLLDFGEHAREFISAEVGLHFLQTMADASGLHAFLANHLSQDKADHLLALLECCVQFKVIPMENHGGRRTVEGGDLCERKNGERVDPNRNWGTDWGVKEKDYVPYEEYGGTAPFSEPESVMVRDTAASFKPHVWINVHSGMQGIFMPYDHKALVANGELDVYTREMLDSLNVSACRGECKVGSGGATVGYLAHGTATDYMFIEMKVPVAMTWEIYGDEAAHSNDCFRMFNPLDRAGVDAIRQRWTEAIFDTLLLMLDHPATADLQLKARVARALALQADVRDSARAGSGVTEVQNRRVGARGRFAGAGLVRQNAMRRGQGDAALAASPSTMAMQVGACVLASLGLWQAARYVLGGVRKRRRDV